MSQMPPAHLDLVAALRAVDSFSALPDETLRELAAEMEVVSLGPGETVIRQDEVVDRLWVVIEGVLGVSFLDRRDSPRALPDLAPGSLIGEMNVFSTTEALRQALQAEMPARPSGTLSWRSTTARALRVAIAVRTAHLLSVCSATALVRMPAGATWRSPAPSRSSPGAT